MSPFIFDFKFGNEVVMHAWDPSNAAISSLNTDFTVLDGPTIKNIRFNSFLFNNTI